MARAPISVAIQVKLLVLSRRRCCLCFGLDNDDTQKDGQIAHVDRDSSSADLDNLAFLCLPHHDKYDSIPRQTKRILPEELKHYRSELYEHLERRRANPPELILKNAEIRDWVKQRQRVTLGWSLSLVPLFLILQMLWTYSKPATARAVEAKPTIQITPRAMGIQGLPPVYVVRPEPKPKNGEQSRGKGLASSPISNAPNDTNGESPSNNGVEPSDCTLSLGVEDESNDQGSEDEPTNQLNLKFYCLRGAFEPGDVFYQGDIEYSRASQGVSLGSNSNLTVGESVRLSWENVEIRYLGAGKFAATEVWSLNSSKLLNGGSREFSLRPSTLLLPESQFDVFGNFSFLRLVFAAFILSAAIAWGSRAAWERHLIRRHHLTIKE